MSRIILGMANVVARLSGIDRMLRMHFIQQWYGLPVEDAIYDSQALRNFCRIDLSIESVPDATTLIENNAYSESVVCLWTKAHW